MAALMRKDYDIINSYDRSENVELNPKQLTNLFVEDDPGGKKGKAIFQTPGLAEKVTFTVTGNGRAARVFDGDIHVSVGQRILAVDSLFNYSTLGLLGSIAGYVGMTDNGRQISYVDGTGGRLFNKDTSVFSVISGAGFPNTPQSCTTFAGRSIVSDGTNQLHFSDLNDASSYPVLVDEFSMKAESDTVVGVDVLGERLFIFGNKQTELWWDAGTPVLPFRITDTLPYGCAAIGSIVSGFGYMIWLAKDENGVSSVMMTRGTDPTPVSSKSILQEFKRYTNPGDARAFIYRNDFGHICYQISFTEDNKSWMYDITDNRWLQLKHGEDDRHLAQAHAYYGSQNYVFSHNSSLMYELSNNYFTDDGVSIRREIVGEPIYDKSYRWIILSSLLFNMRQGVGAHTSETVGTDDNYDPTLRLRLSRDGGLNYGNELRKPVGQVGQRLFDTRFQRLGRARSFVPKITYDATTEFVFLGASMIISVQQEGI